VPASADQKSHAHYVRAVMGERGFRRLLSVRLLSQVGDGFFQGGLAGSVLFNPNQRAGGLAIAAGFAALLVPYSLISPYVGVLLDRWSRRSIIVVSNTIRALLMVPVVLLIWFGQESITLFLLALALIGLNRFFLAGLAAATPHVVEDRMLVTANSVSATVGSIMFSVGLGGTAVLVKTALNASFHGYAAVAFTAAPLYLASALLGRASFTLDALGPTAEERHRASIGTAIKEVSRGSVAGIRHLARKRGAAYLVVAQGVHRALYGVLLLQTLLLYRTVFNTGKDITGSFGAIGKAFVAGGVGLLLAAFVTPPIARRIGGWRWVTALLLATGVSVAAFGLPFDPMLMVFAVFMLGVASQGIKIVVDTSLQHECEDDYRGRVFSMNDTVFNLMLVVGMYIGALLLPETGESLTAVAAIAVLYALLAGGYALVAAGWARRVGDDIAQPDGASSTPPILTRSS
jgi:MFS family permease